MTVTLRDEAVALRDGLKLAPWWVKAVVALGVLYLLSPIDLIPDFIPVLGQLDDLVLLAGLVALVKRYQS